MTSIFRRLAALVRRRRLDRDLDDEIAFHLAMREQQYRDGGATEADARTAARRQFGNVTAVKERTRDVWLFGALETVAQDVRYALRTLRRSPAFAVVAVFTLAVGIGGNTAIFSLVDAIRLRAIPFGAADRLVTLWGTMQRAKAERRGTSYPDYLDWRAGTRSFDDLAAFDSQTVTLDTGDDPERVSGECVSASFFPLLSVAPARGRTFRADEDAIASPVRVVLLGDGLWKRRFGADPNIVGRSIVLNGQPYDVVGVMPPGFKGLSDRAEVWTPFARYAPAAAMAERGNRGFVVLGRLKRGVSLDAAQRDADAVARQLEQAYPKTNAKRGIEVSSIEDELFGGVRPALLTLMAAVAFVMLMACANVANLLLARSEARRRELAVRAAMGAGRGRLLRQLITEACVLTALGALGGIALARAAIPLLLAHNPIAFPSFVAPHIDARVAAFTIAVAGLCGIVIGLAPAWSSRGADLAASLKEAARGSDGRASRRIRGALVVVEVALAVVLLVGAGLTIQSVRRIAAVDPGFDPQSVLTLHVSIPAGRGLAEVREIVDRVGRVPGVSSAAFGSDVPLDGRAAATLYSVEGQPPPDPAQFPRTYAHTVSPDFFAALRIPFVAGRTFDDADVRPSSQAIIVSERIAKRFWPGQDPIGRRIKFGMLPNTNPWFSIVGVVGEVKYRGLPDNPTADPDVYAPFVDRRSQVALAVRTGLPPSSVVDAVRTAIRSVDRAIPIYGVATMGESMADQTAQSRFLMWLMGVFGAVALLLAVVGIYGVMSYLVAQRTREIGIRVALGASGRQILSLVVGNAVRLIAAGVAAGIGGALALQRLVASILFGVTATDGAAILAVTLLAIVALAACYLPARRAARVDPLIALRYE